VTAERPDPQPAGYYGYPALKAPVWTWEVPAYFFVGGAAGAAALIAAAARRAGSRDALVRDARWIAAAGAALSPPLLISDLGRPARFLNMLRVFKLQSPMSVGAWTLVAFSNAAAASAFADLAGRLGGGRLPVRVVADASGMLAAATGLVLSTTRGFCWARAPSRPGRRTRGCFRFISARPVWGRRCRSSSCSVTAIAP
jgi:formate-dependent nitrite reductase membrane component NrfD